MSSVTGVRGLTDRFCNHEAGEEVDGDEETYQCFEVWLSICFGEKGES